MLVNDSNSAKCFSKVHEWSCNLLRIFIYKYIYNYVHLSRFVKRFTCLTFVSRKIFDELSRRKNILIFFNHFTYLTVYKADQIKHREMSSQKQSFTLRCWLNIKINEPHMKNKGTHIISSTLAKNQLVHIYTYIRALRYININLEFFPSLFIFLSHLMAEPPPPTELRYFYSLFYIWKASFFVFRIPDLVLNSSTVHWFKNT